jgi:4-alpha-glucanotransferase
MEPASLNYVPAQTWEDALRTACGLWGIQEAYWDIFGKQHWAPPHVQQAVLRSMGISATDLAALNAAIEARLRSDWSSLVVPTVVASLSDRWLPVQIREDHGPLTLRAVFRWESGEVQEASWPVAALVPHASAIISGTRYVRYRLPLPDGAALGYHSVRVQVGDTSADARLILCPDCAYKPAFLEDGGKAAGIAISLYGIRSQRNWGCGDFTDLYELADWVRDSLGASFIALNPLHSIPNRQPYNTSPYLPNCSYYRNPLYIDIERIEDIRSSALARRLLASDRFRRQIEELRASQYVEYEKVWRLKLRFLKLAFREFLRQSGTDSARAHAFHRYVESEGDLLDRYAIYCALDEVIHKRDRNMWIWPDWPVQYRDPASTAVQEFARRHTRLVLFYKYVQWELDIQLGETQRYARERGLCIGLYHDLALATDRCGSDLWAYPEHYVAGCRVGSPPDDFSPKGQDWAFPPPNSVCHHEEGYRLFIESIRKNCRHGGALRIDHVMRFFRLFWIPDGAEATEGLYVRDYSDDLLRILALESVRNEVIVIGEDLGTVEPYIREALQQFGILSYRLLYFEKNRDGSFRTPDKYPRQALVSVATHDLPTLAGFWLGRDIEARRAAGVLKDAENYREQWRLRQVEKQRLLDVMFEMGLLPDWFPSQAEDTPDFTGELHNAAVGFLAGTPSELMVLSGEDLFKQTDQQNLPGTTAEYPNWRGKLRYTVEELNTDAHAVACALMFRTWLAKTGRLNQDLGCA